MWQTLMGQHTFHVTEYFVLQLKHYHSTPVTVTDLKSENESENEADLVIPVMQCWSQLRNVMHPCSFMT